MEQLNQNNYRQFLKDYNYFGDGYIKQIEYDTKKSEIYIIFDVWPKNRPISKNKPCMEKQTKLKMIFKKIDLFSENNPYMINHIDHIYIDFFHKNEKELVCFSLNSEDPDEEPYLYITCEKIEYEEIDI